jgi:hypothetical protein
MIAKNFKLAIGMIFFLTACGGDDKGTSSSGGSSSGTSGTTSGSSSSSSSGDPATDAGGSSSGATTTPKTIASPELTDLMVMTGGLHVVWNLPPKDTKCETIEGERKSATEGYKVAWTVPGTVDNKHDGDATENTMYTFRVRCKVGAEYSAYSNEMSKNPTTK